MLAVPRAPPGRWRLVIWLYFPLVVYLVYRDGSGGLEKVVPCEDRHEDKEDLVVVSNTGEGRAFMVVSDWDNGTVPGSPDQRDLDYMDYWMPPDGDIPRIGPWRGFKLGNASDETLPPTIQELLARTRLIFADKLLEPVNLVTNITYTQEENLTVFYNLDMSREIRDAIIGGPMNFDKQFKNPCWIARLDPGQPETSYWRNPYYMHNVQGYSRNNLNSVVRLMRRNKARYRIRCLPYFYIGGITKSGTTDLFNVLSHHPDIVGPACKEPFYWNRVRYSGMPNVSFSQFIDVFDTLGAHIMKSKGRRARNKITVDGSPAYLWDFYQWKMLEGNRLVSEPKYILAHTIKAFTPDAKVVVILRNPTDRVFSQFRMWYPNSSLEYFHAASVGSIQSLERCLKSNSLRHCVYKGAFCYNPDIDVGRVCRFIAASFYYIYVRDWMSVLGKDQVFLVKAEDYYKERVSSVQNILNFLGIDHMPDKFLRMLGRKKPINVRKFWRNRAGKGIHSKTRSLLDTLFAPMNRALANLVNDDRFLWKA